MISMSHSVYLGGAGFKDILIFNQKWLKYGWTSDELFEWEAHLTTEL